jgi:RNA polymerase sigma-70 factor (ECF subfamily)
MVGLLLQLKDEMQRTMTEKSREKALVERAQQADRAAFDELTGSVGDALITRIRRRIGRELRPRLDPEDVLQETYLRAFRSIDTFQWKGERSFESWLYGIALNIILHTAREQGKRNVLRITREPQTDGSSPSQRQRREERFDRLEAAVNTLSTDYRTVVRLARLEGLSIAEIAERMNRTPGSVRNLLLRAMKQLRESFGDTESLGLPDRSFESGESNGSD